jgi:UDP-N-acetylmuramate--alanine ligase
MEIMNAQAQGIVTITRAQMLAELMRTQYSIAVAGSHGKTTTSSLIAHILLEAHYDPSIAIGGILETINSNAYAGLGNYMVVEADESDRSFLYLNPTLAVITNIDLEHLETYKDLSDIKDTFTQFIYKIPFYGKAIINRDDAHIRSLALDTINTLSYGIDVHADIMARDITLSSDHSTFSLITTHSGIIENVYIPLAGIHNVYNALAAITVSHEIGVEWNSIITKLATFRGVQRRFSFHGVSTHLEVEVFDDYGHHPKEIYSTLMVARKRAKNRLVVVFQPHRYTRTYRLWDEFLITFSKEMLDVLILTDIYSAGESTIESVTSQRLAQELQTVHPALIVHYAPFTPDFCYINQTILQSTEKHDLVLLLGAGKMHEITTLLVQK